MTRERRAEWNARLARTLRRLGRWADAAARFTAAATWPDPTPSRRERTAAFLEAAECALEEDAERAKTAGKEAIETASRRTIVSPAESRAMAAAAARAHFARPNPALESAVRTFLEATKDDEGDDANRAHRVRGVLLARASARLALARGADAAGAAALDALREAETLVFSSRGDRRSVIGHRSDVVRAARDAALEAVAALDAGWDVEEEGWAAERAFAEESEALALRAAPLVALVPADAPRTSEPAAIVARVWLRLSDPRGPGRGGRVANVPGSAAGAEMLPERDRDALRDALRDATEPTLVRAADEANAAADAGTLGLGAAILGWGALAESSLAANAPRAALDASRAGLRAVRASRAAEERRLGDSETRRLGVSAPGDSETVSDRAGAAERRLRLVAAESLLALGQFADAAAALRAIVPPSPRTLRGLAVAAAGSTASGVPAEDAANEETALLRRAAAEAPEAPRPLAELGWAMLRAGGDGAAGRARRALERAAELAAANSDAAATPDSDVDFAESAPPDVAARLGAARWEETRDASRGPGTAHRALLAAAAAEGPWRASAFARLARVYAASGDASRAEKCARARYPSTRPIPSRDRTRASPPPSAATRPRRRRRVAARWRRRRGVSGRRFESRPRRRRRVISRRRRRRSAPSFAPNPDRRRRGRRWAPRTTRRTDTPPRSKRTPERSNSRRRKRRKPRGARRRLSAEEIARALGCIRRFAPGSSRGRSVAWTTRRRRTRGARRRSDAPRRRVGFGGRGVGARDGGGARGGPGRAVAAAERAAAAARRAAPGRASMKRLGDAFLVAARARDVRDGEADEEEEEDDSEPIASEPIASEPSRRNRSSRRRLGVVSRRRGARGVARSKRVARTRARRWRRTTPPREGTSPPRAPPAEGRCSNSATRLARGAPWSQPNGVFARVFATTPRIPRCGPRSVPFRASSSTRTRTRTRTRRETRGGGIGRDARRRSPRRALAPSRAPRGPPSVDSTSKPPPKRRMVATATRARARARGDGEKDARGDSAANARRTRARQRARRIFASPRRTRVRPRAIRGSVLGGGVDRHGDASRDARRRRGSRRRVAPRRRYQRRRRGGRETRVGVFASTSRRGDDPGDDHRERRRGVRVRASRDGGFAVGRDGGDGGGFDGGGARSRR